jgi:hypothetical protein
MRRRRPGRAGAARHRRLPRELRREVVARSGVDEGAIFLHLSPFSFYFHKYIFFSFISKNDPHLNAITIGVELQRVDAN